MITEMAGQIEIEKEDLPEVKIMERAEVTIIITSIIKEEETDRTFVIDHWRIVI